MRETFKGQDKENASTESDEESAGGSLASDAQLAALRDKLAGNA